MTDLRRPHAEPLRRRWCARRALGIGLIAAVFPHGSDVFAQTGAPPKLNTNQSYIEDLTRPTVLAIDDPMAVFAFVFNSLPDRVKVYPTENYYYTPFTS